MSNVDYVYLYNEYHVNKKSLKNIANSLNKSICYVVNRMDEFGIARRERKEANILAIKGNIWSIGRELSDEHKTKISLKTKGRKLSDETKIRMSNSKKGKTHSEQTKRKQSLIAKNRYKNDTKYREKYLKGRQIHLIKNPTKSELHLLKILKLANEEYEFQKIIDNKYIVDFYIPSKNLIIEVDGGIHNLKNDRDRKRDSELIASGYKVIHISNDSINSFTNKLTRVVEGGVYSNGKNK